MLGVEVHVLDVKVDEFLQPDAGPEEDLDDDAVPDRQGGCPAAKFLEQTGFGLGQKLGGVRELRRSTTGGVSRRSVPLGQVNNYRRPR